MLLFITHAVVLQVYCFAIVMAALQQCNPACALSACFMHDPQLDTYGKQYRTCCGTCLYDVHAVLNFMALYAPTSEPFWLKHLARLDRCCARQDYVSGSLLIIIGQGH